MLIVLMIRLLTVYTSICMNETSAILETSKIWQYFIENYYNRYCNKDIKFLKVDGGRSSSTIHNMKALARDRNNDHPLLVFLELIGNDVCSKHPEVEHMTSTTEFKSNILTILN